MDLRKVNLVLRNFGHSVVQEAKSNAPKDRVSGKLKDSISFTQFANKNATT